MMDDLGTVVGLIKTAEKTGAMITLTGRDDADRLIWVVAVNVGEGAVDLLAKVDELVAKREASLGEQG